MIKTISLFLLVLFAGNALALDAKTVRLVLWKKGEAMGGDDFLAANEEVVDYLATLKRPTEVGFTKYIRYNCQVKYRQAQPTLQLQGGATQPQSGWVNLVMVYSLRDCVEVRE